MKPRNLRRMAQYRTTLRRGFRLLLVLAIVAMLFFGIRLSMMAGVWHDQPTLQDPISGWMTPRYVSRSWQVPPDIVATALALEPDGNGRRVTLAELAAEQGVDLDTLIGTLTAAVAAYQAQHDD